MSFCRISNCIEIAVKPLLYFKGGQALGAIANWAFGDCFKGGVPSQVLGSTDALSLVLQVEGAVAVRVSIGDFAGKWHI